MTPETADKAVGVAVARSGSVDGKSLEWLAAVTEAASQCEFRPARRRGKAVAVLYQLNFNLMTK